MKLTATSLITAVVMMISGNLNAAGSFNVYPSEDARKVNVELSDLQLETVSMKLLDKRRNLIHNEEIMGGTVYSNQIDFENKKNGTYYLVFEIGNLKLNKTIHLNDEKAEVVSRHYSSIPEFMVSDKNLFIHYINEDADEVRFLLEDRFGNTYAMKYDYSGGIFSGGLSMDDLDRGVYFITLTSGKESYSYRFEI